MRTADRELWNPDNEPFVLRVCWINPTYYTDYPFETKEDAVREGIRNLNDCWTDPYWVEIYWADGKVAVTRRILEAMYHDKLEDEGRTLTESLISVGPEGVKTHYTRQIV